MKLLYSILIRIFLIFYINVLINILSRVKSNDKQKLFAYHVMKGTIKGGFSNFSCIVSDSNSISLYDSGRLLAKSWEDSCYVYDSLATVRMVMKMKQFKDSIRYNQIMRIL